MRIALGLEYDGAAFCGWQSQPGGCGVQDHVEAALSQFADAPISVVAAGRTDAGVHAVGQVVHFDTEAERSREGWVRGPNAHLERAVRVAWAKEVPGDFHARFSALARTYRYLMVDQPVAPAIGRTQLGWFHQPLDDGAMHRAAQALVGEHDFSAFRDAQCQAKSPVRHVTRIDVRRRAGLVDITVRANAFLHHMVRNIVGSLVYVGAGRQPVDWLETVLKGRDRRLAAPTFAPDGLYLAHVDYDRTLELPPASPHPLLSPC